MSSGISKFGYSENTSVGMIGPRGLPGKDGIDGKDGKDGADAVFSFTENMNANDKNITNVNLLEIGSPGIPPITISKANNGIITPT